MWDMDSWDARILPISHWNHGIDDKTVVDMYFGIHSMLLDDKDSRIHVVILANDLRKKAGFLIDLMEQPIYYKDTFLLMLALDELYKPNVCNVF